MRYFCTYFDHRYLSRGLALHESLRAHAGDFRLWVLCASPECRQLLEALRLPGVTIISLEDFERGDAELAAAKANRSLIEYYFTLTPSLPLYVFAHWPEVELVTYLDADLFFFSSPQPLYQELGDASVLLIPHRFSSRCAHFAENGLYNVSWLSFRRNKEGLDCLHWWRKRCNEWCYDRQEDGRFADQKYLDHFPRLFTGVVILQHPGANLAAWNMDRHALSTRSGEVLVDGQPLIFFHFHGFKELAPGCYDPFPPFYRIFVTVLIQRLILRPYIRALKQAEQSYLDKLPHEQSLRSGNPVVSRLALALGIARRIYVASEEHKSRYYRLLFPIFWAYDKLLDIYGELRRQAGRRLKRCRGVKGAAR